MKSQTSLVSAKASEALESPGSVNRNETENKGRSQTELEASPATKKKKKKKSEIGKRDADRNRLPLLLGSLFPHVFSWQ